MTKIQKCDCKHDYQDRMYGQGNRVHNELKDPVKSRCTVCGKTR